MRSYQNPFRARAAEFSGDPRAFWGAFADEILDFLPDDIETPVILRSPPGAGKTTLMQALAAPWVAEVIARPDDLSDVRDQLVHHKLISLDRRPAVAGILINMGGDFGALMDIGAPGDVAERLFCRLLDARVFAGLVESVLTLSNASVGTPAITRDDVLVRVNESRTDLIDIADQVCGSPKAFLTGSELIDYAGRTERFIRGLLNDLRPVEWDRIASSAGSRSFASLRLLAAAEIQVKGRSSTLRPLTLLDDVHLLHRSQREALHAEIRDRSSGSRRLWLAIRDEVLQASDLLTAPQEDERSTFKGEAGRDFIEIRLDDPLRNRSYDRVLTTVAKRRSNDLSAYAGTQLDFLSMLDAVGPSSDPRVEAELVVRLESIDDPRFAEWTTWLLQVQRDRARVQRLGLAIINSVQRQSQEELFLGVALPVKELIDRVSSSNLEAAGLALGREFRAPVYFGASTLLTLANDNVSQLLRVGGDMFDQALGAITRDRRSPSLTPKQQHAVIIRTSTQLWREIPSRLSNGRDVQRLLMGFADFARAETIAKPVSYAPGISGWAFKQSEHDRLLNTNFRKNFKDGDAVLEAIRSAVAHNYLSCAPRSRGKSEDRQVFYLNRLLCPAYGLPVGRGGYRTKTTSDVAAWLSGARAGSAVTMNQGDLFDA